VKAAKLLILEKNLEKWMFITSGMKVLNKQKMTISTFPGIFSYADKLIISLLKRYFNMKCNLNLCFKWPDNIPVEIICLKQTLFCLNASHYSN